MGDEFLDLAKQGKNAWWRYLLAAVLILIGSMAFATAFAALLGVALALDNNPGTYWDISAGTFVGADPSVYSYIGFSSFIAILLSLFLVVRLVHKRPFKSLITPFSGFDWRRASFGFGVFFALGAAASLVEALLYPGRYQLTWNPGELVKYLPLIFILIPVQSATEEIVFRGYVMQGVGLLTRRALIPALVSSLIFMSVHIPNPEVSANALPALISYFGIGLLFALVTLRDGRLELAIGAHAAVNIFAGLVVGYPDSVLNTPAIFTLNVVDMTYSLASLVVSGVVFYVVVFRLDLVRAAGARVIELVRPQR